jgi:hypothetical protein
MRLTAVVPTVPLLFSMAARDRRGDERFAQIRARRIEFIREPEYLREILRAGNERANAIAEQTLCTVRQLMHTVY